MACKDPSITYLKSFGYSVIRLPRKDIAPLDIMVENRGQMQRLGRLDMIIRQGAVPLPPLKADTPAATVSGQKTGELRIGLGLSILGNLIGAMGGSKLGLDLKYQHARKLTFQFEEVLEDRIEVAQLDQFLAAADIHPNSRHVGTLLEADDVYVLTAALKSRRFTVEAQSENGGGLTVDVPAIQGLVSGGIEVATKNTTQTQVTYSGPEPLVFGFQAVRLIYKEGVYRAFDVLPPGTASAAPGSMPLPEFLKIQGPFLALSEVSNDT